MHPCSKNVHLAATQMPTELGSTQRAGADGTVRTAGRSIQTTEGDTAARRGRVPVSNGDEPCKRQAEGRQGPVPTAGWPSYWAHSQARRSTVRKSRQLSAPGRFWKCMGASVVVVTFLPDLGTGGTCENIHATPTFLYTGWGESRLTVVCGKAYSCVVVY